MRLAGILSISLLSTFLLSALLAACGEQQTAPSAPLIESFSAAPATLTTAGREVILSWDIRGSATTLTLEPGISFVAGSSVRVSPKATTTYTLTASNEWGSRSAKTTVTLPEPEAATPLPNSALFGVWVFEIVGEKGSAISGEILTDTTSSYQGTPSVWGSVSDCRGNVIFCKGARVGGIMHKPGTDMYQFGLGQRDMALTFSGKDSDAKLAENTPLHFMLEGVGRIGQDEQATFKVYQLGK